MGCGAASGSKDGDPNIITPESIPRYIRKQLIGKGTYGEVYKCVDSITNSVYAMKVIKLNSKSKQQAIKQITELKSEISMLKKLNHPYIVKYQSFDVTPNQDEVEIVMELIKPGTLKQYIQKNGPLSQPVCAQVAAKILQALVYLHQQFIIHRDLKCANILITDDLIPKISDFGTAKIIYSRDIDDIAKMSASLKGTPYYMAPEVIKRSGHNQSADIWSFGCLVIQMLSGKAPWTAMNAKFSEIINYISSGVHPPFPPNISRQCNFFLESCLDAIPSKRLTAEQLLKHRFIDRNSTNATLSAKKDRNRKQSQSKPKSRTTLLNDMEIQNLEVDDRGQSGSSTVRKQINYQTPTEKRQENDPDLRKHGRRDSTSKPVKKHTQKYLNQLSRLDMLEAEMNEVEISEQQPAKDRYFIKKTLANIKSNKNSKNISKTSTTIKNTEDNLANMSSSVVDYQLRSNTEMSRQQTAINTMISRAERDQYLEQQKFLQKQRENQKKKWQQELKEGAQMLKKQLSSRYMYKV